MTRAADIHDRDSLEAWLETRPHEDAVAIAARAALRVMPVWAEFCETEAARKRDLTPLPVLWANLVSAVAAVSPTAEIKRAADAAEAYTAATATADAADAYTAADAAAAAAYTAATDATAAYTAATASAARATTTTAARATAWDAVRTDAEQIEAATALQSQPLWPAKNPLQATWDAVKPDWTAPGAPYDFFRRWYETLLAGTPLNPDMLYKIALIDDAVWEEGVEAVAKEIARIEARYQVDDPVAAVALPASHHLRRNARTIRLQLDTLKSLLQSEAETLRQRNSVPPEDVPEFEKRIAVLACMIERVEAMAGEFEGGIASENALMVVEQNLPALPDEAAAFEETGGDPEVSDLVVSMGATIEHLTKRGTPGAFATGIAAFDYAWRQFGLWRSKRASHKQAH